MIRKISLTLATVVIPLFAAYAALRYFSSLPTTATRSDFLGKVDDFYSLTAESLSGGVVKFDKYKGQVVLVVNVASNCGYTHQYQGLQELFEKYSPRLAILGFPCNQFGRQEPGNGIAIREFCTSKFSVTFDLFAKVDVNGPNTHSVFQHLKAHAPGEVSWNFAKFLVDRGGTVVKRYGSGDLPEHIGNDVIRLIGG